MSGAAVKATPDQTREEDPLQNGKFRTSCCPWNVVKFWYQFVFYIATAGLIKYIFKSNSDSPKTQNKNRKRDTEFTENLEDTEMPAPAHISQDSDSERRAKVVTKSRKHRIYTHFPKDRNCEVCLRNKMTRAPCRRRTGEAPPRAEKFGDLKTADHKVLNEEGESRNKHRYAVLVQDLATQWIQSYLSKTKTSQGTDKSLKICHGIIELRRLAVPRQMVLLRVRHAESRNVCCTVAIRLG